MPLHNFSKGDQIALNAFEKCKVVTEKAFLQGQKAMRGVMPIWSQLVEARLHYQWSPEVEETISSWAIKIIQRIEPRDNASGIILKRSILCADEILRRPPFSDASRNKPIVCFKEYLSFARRIAGEDEFKVWLTSTHDNKLWWCSTSEIISSDVFSSVLNETLDLDERLSTNSLFSVFAVDPTNIPKLFSKWLDHRYSTEIDCFDLNYLHPKLGKELWSVVLDHSNPYSSNNNFLLTKRAEGFINNTIPSSVDLWNLILTSPKWVNALMNNPESYEQYKTVYWHKDKRLDYTALVEQTKLISGIESDIISHSTNHVL